MTIGNWYWTAKRAKRRTRRRRFILNQMGIISKDGISKIADAEGRLVGNVQGYLWTDDIQNVFGGKPKLYPNTVAMAQDSTAGRIEVGFESYTVVKEAQKAGAYPGSGGQGCRALRACRGQPGAGPVDFPPHQGKRRHDCRA